MEGEACMHVKLGFCEFKDTCKEQHFSQTCELFSACKTLQTCKTRHPKPCKLFSNGWGCRFGKDCDYRYKNTPGNPEYESLKKKMEYLEKVVQKMAIKVIQLIQE